MRTYSNSVVLRNDGTDPLTMIDDLNAGISKTVTVREASLPVAGVGSLASIFDINGIPTSNPILTDDNGNYTFQAASGLYDLVIEEGILDIVSPGIDLTGGEAVEDPSQTYNFDTEPAYKASSIEFPVGKRVHLKDNGAYYYVLGNLGGDIDSDTVGQSLELDRLSMRGKNGGMIFSDGYGIPKGADQTNLANFAANFTVRHNPNAVYPGLVGINNPTDSSVFDFANFGGQDMMGFDPIGFVFHHYADASMVQMDNVGEDNEILVLKNANNSTRRPDKPTDFIGDGKFLVLRRNESDGGGGVTATREGFYISKDFELVWPQQVTGNPVKTVRLVNNIAAPSGFWTHEFNNTNELQFLFRIDNGGTAPFSVQWISGAQSTQVASHKALQIKATDGILQIDSSELVRSNAPIRPQVYSRAGLPSFTVTEIGAQAYLQDGTDKYPVHWDGSAWLKVSDNTAA